MQIYGLDFTSAPSRRKPITCAVARWSSSLLIVDDLLKPTGFPDFEAFLNRPGPWLAGLDFPFGQPRKLIQNLGWPNTWAGYVGHIGAMTKQEFEETLARYRRPRPKGDKQHLRAIDAKANSRSPMMLYGVPVGKMFFQGAPRLLKTGASILPCRPTADHRIVLETYPALPARKWIGPRTGYKSDTKKKQTAAKESARREIVRRLRAPTLQAEYGLTIQLSDSMAAALIQDPTGDDLDAVLCALQAGWAYSQRDQGYGIPPGCDPLEGWIVDPEMIT